MKKVIILSIAILFSLAMFAQDNGPSSDFGVSIFPKSTRQISDDKEMSVNLSEFNISLYGDVFLNLNPKLQLKTGVGLHSYEFRQVDFSPLLGCDNMNGMADQFSSFFQHVTSSYYIGLPVEIRVLFSKEPKHLYLKGGLENLFGIWSKNTSKLFSCGSVTTITNTSSDDFLAKKYLLLLKIGLGYEFEINEKLQAYLEPTFEYAPIKTFEETEGFVSNYNTMNIGILAGMRF